MTPFTAGAQRWFSAEGRGAERTSSGILEACGDSLRAFGRIVARFEPGIDNAAGGRGGTGGGGDNILGAGGGEFDRFLDGRGGER